MAEEAQIVGERARGLRRLLVERILVSPVPQAECIALVELLSELLGNGRLNLFQRKDGLARCSLPLNSSRADERALSGSRA